ncbi:MAG: hypothetical protein Q7W16_05525 [Coriobacteriia bacterium]|nr:hypothetical protein [Coriobacteriia bacterium]
MTAKRKHLLLVVGVIALVAMLVPGVALANNGVHGNYAMNTDQCAGCHRAHTAPSTITWQRTDINPSTGTDPLQRTGLDPGERSALLLGNATDISEFCYTCHGATALGADTNVELGVYQTGASAGVYGTVGSPLISGAFGKPETDIDGVPTGRKLDFDGKPVTSRHFEFSGSWAAYGGGSVAATAGTLPSYDASLTPGTGESLVKLGCDGCHDVHGTSNYRLLKNQVYGVTVGGYVGAVPTPYVTSVEVGYPSTANGYTHDGFAKGTTYPGYQPDYTTPKYAKPSDPTKGMSGWCVGCHTYYMGQRNVSDTQAYYVYGGVAATQHRHPVNVPLSNFGGGGTTLTAVSPSATADPTMQLPLAHGAGEASAIVNDNTDWLDCMTCHTAHGSTAVMTGWAATAPTAGSAFIANGTSALLRFDNRYVCQACHSK